LNPAHRRIFTVPLRVVSHTFHIPYVSDINPLLSVAPTTITSVFPIFSFNDSHHTCTTYSQHTHCSSLSITWSS
jgi:hypothetical protein